MAMPMPMAAASMAAPMMAPMLPQPQIDNFQNVPGFKAGMDSKVTTASIPICKLPKVRLTEAIEFLEERLDSTITSNAHVTQELAAIVIWLLSGIKPNTKLTDLRCKHYVEVYDRFRAAKDRKKALPEFKYAELADHLVRCELDPDQVAFFLISFIARGDLP